MPNDKTVVRERILIRNKYVKLLNMLCPPIVKLGVKGGI